MGDPTTSTGRAVPACPSSAQSACGEHAPTSDPVNKPAHYTRGSIEVRDFIADQGLNFNRGSAIKYITRAGHKDPSKEIEDLKKARSCIEHEIARLEGK